MGVQKMDHSPVSCPDRTLATRAVAYGKANSSGRYRGDLEGIVTDTPDSSIELCIAKAIPNPNDEQERLCLSEAIANEENERLKYTGSIDPLTDVSIPRIIRFAVPAVGIWLCSPLLSVIDTATVGMMSGTVQQAALHPAVAITDYTARLMVRQKIRAPSMSKILLTECQKSSFCLQPQPTSWRYHSNQIARQQEWRVPLVETL